MANEKPWCEYRISHADIQRLTNYVRRRASRLLQDDDVEDLVGEILAEALFASRRTGISMMKLAHAAAKRPRYYTRARARVSTRVGELVHSSDEEDDDRSFVAPDDLTEVVATQDLVDRLPQGLREAFVLCAIRGATLEEASTEAGVPVSTLHRRLAAAKDVLQAVHLAAEAA